VTVAEFREFLVQLADVHRQHGELEEADALLRLSDIFDSPAPLKVAKFVEQIRRVKRIAAASG
jgi:hypothetical protein